MSKPVVRPRRLLMPVLLAVAMLPVAASADPKSDFATRYEQLEQAMETREPEQIKPLLAPDYSVTDLRGRKQDLDAVLDRLAMIPVDPARRELTSVDAVTVTGDTALVTQHRDRSGSREGRDGKTHTMRSTIVSQDTWVQSPRGWLLRSSEAQSMTMSRDGEPARTIRKGDPMPERGFGRRRDGQTPTSGDMPSPPPAQD